MWYYTEGLKSLYSKRPIFRVQTGKKLHRTEKIYTDAVCGVCDKYEVWSCQRYFYGKIRKINEMLTWSRLQSSSWMVSPCWRRTCIFLGKVLSCRWLWVEWAFSLDFSVLRVWISLIKDQYFYIWCQLHFPFLWNMALGL